VYVLEEGKEKCFIGKTDERWIWHKILDHLSFNQLFKLGRKDVVRDMPKISKLEYIVYKSCQIGKQSRVIFKAREHSTTRPIESIDTNVRGHTSKQSPQGERYLIFFIDDYTRMTWVGLLKNKFESFEKFKIFKSQVENEMDLKTKCLI
jgi:hypothetical protein